MKYVEIFSNFRIPCILNSSEGLVVKQQICKEQYPILFRLKEAVFRDMRVDIGWLLCFSWHLNPVESIDLLKLKFEPRNITIKKNGAGSTWRHGSGGVLKILFWVSGCLLKPSLQHEAWQFVINSEALHCRGVQLLSNLWLLRSTELEDTSHVPMHCELASIVWKFIMFLSISWVLLKDVQTPFEGWSCIKLQGSYRTINKDINDLILSVK